MVVKRQREGREEGRGKERGEEREEEIDFKISRTKYILHRHTTNDLLLSTRLNEL